MTSFPQVRRGEKRTDHTFKGFLKYKIKVFEDMYFFKSFLQKISVLHILAIENWRTFVLFFLKCFDKFFIEKLRLTLFWSFVWYINTKNRAWKKRRKTCPTFLFDQTQELKSRKFLFVSKFDFGHNCVILWKVQVSQMSIDHEVLHLINFMTPSCQAKWLWWTFALNRRLRSVSIQSNPSFYGWLNWFLLRLICILTWSYAISRRKRFRLNEFLCTVKEWFHSSFILSLQIQSTFSVKTKVTTSVIEFSAYFQVVSKRQLTEFMVKQ